MSWLKRMWFGDTVLVPVQALYPGLMLYSHWRRTEVTRVVLQGEYVAVGTARGKKVHPRGAMVEVVKWWR